MAGGQYLRPRPQHSEPAPAPRFWNPGRLMLYGVGIALVGMLVAALLSTIAVASDGDPDQMLSPTIWWAAVVIGSAMFAAGLIAKAVQIGNR